jgi:uncharacterized protein with HEPN domain
VSRSWQLFLRDMVEAAQRIIRYTAGRDAESFVADEMAYDAALRNLEILGEGAKKIPEEIRQRYPAVDWRGVAGLRDILSHAYFALENHIPVEILHRIGDDRIYASGKSRGITERRCLR